MLKQRAEQRALISLFFNSEMSHSVSYFFLSKGFLYKMCLYVIAQYIIIGFIKHLNVNISISHKNTVRLIQIKNLVSPMVQVNGITTNLPALLNGGRVSVYASGSRIFVSADFGLSVTYDGWSTVSVSVPSNYRYLLFTAAQI